MQPIDVRHKAEKLGITPEYLSKIHRRSIQRIYDAYKGKAPNLLKRINNHLSKLQSKVS